jgi:Flp pilus assembly protein TadG
MWLKLKERLTHRTMRYAKCESGAPAVEFAMVAFPFFMLLGVIIESGTMMFAEYTLQASVQQAGRLVRTGQAQGGEYSAADFKAAICKTAGVLINCTGGVTVYLATDTTFAALKAKLPSFLNVGAAADGSAGPTSYQCGGPLSTTAVVATYDWTFVFPFMSFNNNVSTAGKRRLVGFSLFENEPFPAGTSCK